MYKSLTAQTFHYLARPHEGVPRQPVTGPTAWHGEALRETPETWQVRLSELEIGELDAAIAQAEGCGKPMRALTAADFPLDTLRHRLRDWRKEVHHGRGIVLLRGLPVERWTEAQAELAFWCLGHYLGIPGAQNPEGDLLGHVRDQRAGGDIRHYRTNKALEPHSDAADIVGLLCLKAARSGGLSRIASSVAIYNEILARRPGLVGRLFEPMHFDTKGEGGLRAFPIPPCAYSNGDLRTFWQSDYFRTARAVAHVPEFTPAEQELVDLFDEIAGDPRFYLDMELAAGDVQLLSNHHIVHARTGFEDWPDPAERRHLLRLWLSVPEPRSLRQRALIARSRAQILAAGAAERIRTRLAA